MLLFKKNVFKLSRQLSKWQNGLHFMVIVLCMRLHLWMFSDKDCWTLIAIIIKWIITEVQEIGNHGDILLIKLLWSESAHNNKILTIIHVFTSSNFCKSHVYVPFLPFFSS